jgi:transposase InsO family protein
MQRDVARIAEGSAAAREHFETLVQAKDEAIDWLVRCNQTRLHSTLNYVSPTQFEQDWNRSTAAIAS